MVQLRKRNEWGVWEMIQIIYGLFLVSVAVMALNNITLPWWVFLGTGVVSAVIGCVSAYVGFKLRHDRYYTEINGEMYDLMPSWDIVLLSFLVFCVSMLAMVGGLQHV